MAIEKEVKVKKAVEKPENVKDSNADIEIVSDFKDATGESVTSGYNRVVTKFEQAGSSKSEFWIRVDNVVNTMVCNLPNGCLVQTDTGIVFIQNIKFNTEQQKFYKS